MNTIIKQIYSMSLERGTYFTWWPALEYFDNCKNSVSCVVDDSIVVLEKNMKNTVTCAEYSTI